MAKVLACSNLKGGTGKTTTSVNLGIALAREGKRVLIVDCDQQGNMGVALGIEQPDELEASLSDIMRCVIEERGIPPDYALHHHEEGVDFIPANIELSGLEFQMVSLMGREHVLKQYIDSVKDKYDYVLLDCAPSIGVMTINALAAADSVIIPAQPQHLSAKGFDQLLKTIARVKRQINPALKVDGILFTMVDRRTNLARDIIDIVRKHYGTRIRVFDAEIPLSVRAAEAVEHGKSIFSHDKNGKVAVAYAALAKESANKKSIEK